LLEVTSLEIKDVELLAPAGNFEAMVAAIKNGADAVYLGGKAFGARHYASNFDNKDLTKATRFVHQRNKKIYITVNTLLSDRELEQAAYYLKFLYEIGVDAVIVQDLGLIKMISDLFPKLEVHASTQMTINNADGVNFLEQNGVTRVVLAREVSLENIRLIKQNSNLELETFVHGALCVCYSGQCLMSSMIGGRSGNRGKCAQPCRMKYQLTDINGKDIKLNSIGEHLLSPKDLKTVDFLPKIIEAGVTSLKIEGRMKRPEYVATVTRIYKNALERYFSGNNLVGVTEQEEKELAQIFNRDFSSGYYKKNQGSDLMSYKRPNNRGLFIGRVSSVQSKKNLAVVKLVEDLYIGDGLEFWVTRGGRKGLTVEKIWVNGKPVSEAKANQEATIEIEYKVFAGDRIFKTYDAKLMEKAQESYQNLEIELKSPIKMEVLAKVDSPLLLTVRDREGNVVQAETSFIVEKAIKRQLTPEVVRVQLERLGNTPYFLTDLTCNIHGEVMVPLSELNNVRRAAVEKLEGLNKKSIDLAIDEKVIQDYLQPRSYNAKPQRHLPLLSVFVSSTDGALKAIEAGATRIYLSTEHLRSLKKEKISFQKFLEKALVNHIQIIIALPRIWHQKEKPRVQKLINEFEGKEITGFLVGNLGTLELMRDCRNTKKIFLDYPMNVFNSLAFSFLQNQGQIDSITLSPEMTFEQLRELNVSRETERECIIHGYLPLMISEYCAVGALLGGKNSVNSCAKPCLGKHYGIKDRLNIVFPLEMDEGCRMHIYNSKELCLIDDLERFKDYDISSLRIEARRYSSEEIELVVGSYKKALEILEGKGNKKEALTKLKAQLERWKNDSYTKGHYYRGVL
jgi:putative protease